jgi:hypothetical protein
MPASTKKPRGHPSWVTGTKLEFLDQYSVDWQTAIDKGTHAAGLFYTKITKCFIKKYGWDFNRWSSSDEVPDPDESTINDEDSQEGLSDDEVTKQNEYFHDLREVRFSYLVWHNGTMLNNHCQAILAWYHNHNSKVVKDDNAELDNMLLDIARALQETSYLWHGLNVIRLDSTMFSDPWSGLETAYSVRWIVHFY